MMKLSVVTMCMLLLVESAVCQLNFGGNQQATRNFPSTSRGSSISSVGVSREFNPGVQGVQGVKEFTHTVNKKFFNFNRCCRQAERYCYRPCAGQECAANCRVQCGLLGGPC